MSQNIMLSELIQTFRGAAASCHIDAGHTIDGGDYDAIKREEASHHAYADALEDGETLRVLAPGGHEIGRVTPSKDRTERATAAAKAFVEAVCSMDHNHAAFVAEICKQHRTHQQSVMRAMHAVMQGLAKEEHDLRNEATVKFCKSVDQDAIFPFI